MIFKEKRYTCLQEIFGVEENFSKWLASDDDEGGIEYIKSALGVEVVSEGTEVSPTGHFSADIVMRTSDIDDESESVKIIIENQYGKTDHNHLSKLITYALENEATYSVWIAEDVDSTHKKVIDWLNANTNPGRDIYFYLFKAVVEEIGDSKEKHFELIPICEPDENSRIINSIANKELSVIKFAQLEFWKTFSDQLKKSKFNIRKPRPQHWYNISAGLRDAVFSVCINIKESSARLEFYISNNVDLYNNLYNKKDEIESDIGRKLIWENKENKKSCKICYVFPNKDFDFSDDKKYIEYSEKIIKELTDKFKKISDYAKENRK